MSRAEMLFAAADGPSAFAKAYLADLAGRVAAVDPESVGAVVECLLQARSQGRQVFVMGNGGSAAAASHLVNDLLVGVRATAPPFRVTGLSDNAAVLTCIANDHGFEEVFRAQLEGRVVPGDVVIAFSASGHSPNVLLAARAARVAGATIIAFTGFDGGELRPMADISVHVPTEPGDYGLVEDTHLLAKHTVTTCLLLALRSGAPR